MMELIKKWIRPFLWISAILSDGVPLLKGIPNIYEGIYDRKALEDPFYLKRLPKPMGERPKLFVGLITVLLVFGGLSVKYNWQYLFPPIVELPQPPCMMQTRYDAAVNFGAQGLRNFIKECKDDGGDLLHRAYDDLGTLLYKTSITCLKNLPVCQERASNQCVDDYQKNGVSPNVANEESPDYAQRIDVEKELGRGVAECLAYSMSYPKPKFRPSISVRHGIIKGNENNSFAGFTIQYEITESSKDCTGKKCYNGGPVSNRYMLYIDSNGKYVVFFGRVDIGKELESNGDKTNIGNSYMVGPTNGNWRYQRTIKTDQSNDVLIIETKVWDVSSPIHEEVAQIFYITKSGTGCYVKHTTLTSSTDEKTEHTYEPLMNNQSCRLYTGLHKKWGP